LLSQATLLKEIVANKKLYGECPSCGEGFPLTKAQLFFGKPSTTLALEAIEKLSRKLEEGFADLEQKKLLAKQRSKRGVLDVNVGKVLEKIAPALPGFSFDCHDCRALSEPIDYIVFDGLTKNGRVDYLRLIDIKTGESQLNTHQRQIRDAVSEGRVEWNTYNKVI